MRNPLLAVALIVSCLLPAGLASAESTAAPDRVESFDDELVPGDLAFSDMEILHVRPRGARRSLIRTREHFVPEMMESVEDL